MILHRATVKGLAGFAFLLAMSTVRASDPGHPDAATVSVDCERGSGLIHVNIQSDRRIGRLTIVVKDAQGRTVYREEGKAHTEGLVRSLDKGLFPKGAATLTVEAKDFAVSRPFTIQ